MSTIAELLNSKSQNLVAISEGLNLQQIESFGNSEVSHHFGSRRRNKNPIVGKVKQDIKHYPTELRGMPLSVPYLSSSTTTFVKGGELVKEDRLPVWINHILGDLENPGRGRINQAKKSIAYECAQQIRNQLTLKLRSFSAPISVSNELAPNEFKVLYDNYGTPTRILVNEEIMELRAIDADGDRGYLTFSEDGMKALFGKFPFTKKALVLKKHLGPLFEQFRNFELMDVVEEEHDVKKVFIKCHTNVNVGILTQKWNSYEAFLSLKQKTWEDKVAITFADDGRYEDIEEGGLQGTRNDKRKVGELGRMNIDSKVKFLLSGLSRVMLTSASGIRKLEGKELMKAIDTPLDDFVEKYVKLNLKSSMKLEGDSDFEMPSAGYEKYGKEPVWTIADRGMIKRIVESKRMKFEIVGTHFSGLPIVKITLVTKEGHPVGLIDQKRDSYDLPDKGLGFHYLLPPVYSTTRKEWISGLSHMMDKFATMKAVVWNKETESEEVIFKNWKDYKFVIKNPTTNECCGFFPRKNVDDWSNPGLKVMVDDAMEAISAFCGSYGMLVNSGEDRVAEVISPINMTIVEHSLIIDYGMVHTTPDTMYPIFMEAQEALQNDIKGNPTFICPGNKQTNMEVRKYAMAHPNGVAIWGDPQAHVGRTGKMLSQLSRALHKGTYRVAIVPSLTKSQCYFTESGVEKQSHVRAFYNQVMTDVNEAELYAERKGIKLSDLHQTEIYSWNGTKKIVWVTSPKHQISLGKFVDGKYGMKFMPREIMGAKIIRNGKKGKTVPDRIDCIIPPEELIAKGCYNAMMQKAKPELVSITQYYNGELKTETVEAYVLDMVLYRSGSHSENTQASHGIMRVGGFDQFAMYPGLIEMGYTDPDAEFGIPTPNWDFVDSLRKCFNEINVILGVNRRIGKAPKRVMKKVQA